MSSYVCPNCGLDYDTISPSDGKIAIRSFPRRYRGALAAAVEDESEEAISRRRPEPEVWSGLEYAAHVRDILSGTAGWVRELRVKENPTVAMPGSGLFDVVEKGGSSPEEVLASLEEAASGLADELDRVDGSEWGRTGIFPWGERDLLITMRNAVHEGSHHLKDVERVLDTVRAQG